MCTRAAVGVRFRAERTVAVRQHDARRGRAERGATVDRDRPAPDDGRSGEAGAGAEPRHPDPADRSADSGCRRDASEVVLGAEPHLRRLEAVTVAAGDQRAVGRRHLDRKQLVWDSGRHQSAAPLGRQLQRDLEQLALFDDEPLQQLLPAAEFDAEPAGLTAAAAELLGRSDSPTGAEQQEDARPVGHPAAGRHHADDEERPQCVLGSGLRAQQLQGAAAVAGAVAAVPERQSEARRDRHAGADRHRPGAGRSGEQRVGRHCGRRRDQDGTGQLAEPDSRPRHGRLLEHRVRSDRCRVVRRAGD